MSWGDEHARMAGASMGSPVGRALSPIDDTKPALRDAKPAFPVLRQRCIIELLSPEGRLVQAESANALGQATRRSPGLRGSARSCQIGARSRTVAGAARSRAGATLR